MKILRSVCCLCLLLVALMAISPAVLAQEEVLEEIEMQALYPTIEAIAGGEFVFEVQFMHIGENSRDFKLNAITPEGWDVYITPKYEKDNKISSITLEPAYAFANPLRIVVDAPLWPLPDPGEYPITLEASAGEIRGSIELTAKITARYTLNVIPAVEQRYNTTAVAGKDNFFSLKVQNLSTAAVNNIKFSTDKPEGWAINFTPDKIELMEPVTQQTVDMNIKPPSNAVAGDYNISVMTSGKEVTADRIQIRVTVESPAIWGWVGVGIIVVVIAGLIVIFMRFGRR